MSHSSGVEFIGAIDVFGGVEGVARKHANNRAWRETVDLQPVPHGDVHPVANPKFEVESATVCIKGVAVRGALLNEHELFTDAVPVIRARFSRFDVIDPKQPLRCKRQRRELRYSKRPTWVTVDRERPESRFLT